MLLCERAPKWCMDCSDGGRIREFNVGRLCADEGGDVKDFNVGRLSQSWTFNKQSKKSKFVGNVVPFPCADDEEQEAEELSASRVFVRPAPHGRSKKQPSDGLDILADQGHISPGCVEQLRQEFKTTSAVLVLRKSEATGEYAVQAVNNAFTSITGIPLLYIKGTTFASQLSGPATSNMKLKELASHMWQGTPLPATELILYAGLKTKKPVQVTISGNALRGYSAHSNMYKLLFEAGRRPSESLIYHHVSKNGFTSTYERSKTFHLEEGEEERKRALQMRIAQENGKLSKAAEEKMARTNIVIRKHNSTNDKALSEVRVRKDLPQSTRQGLKADYRDSAPDGVLRSTNLRNTRSLDDVSRQVLQNKLKAAQEHLEMKQLGSSLKERLKSRSL